MNCRTIEREIQSYLDGNLSVQREEALLAHVAICPPCAQKLAEEKAFGALLQESYALKTPPAEFSDQLMAKIMALPNIHKAPKKKMAWPVWTRYSLLGSAAVVALAVYLSGMDIPGLSRPIAAPVFVAEEPTTTTPVVSQPDKTSVAQVTPNNNTGQNTGGKTETGTQTNNQANTDTPGQTNGNGEVSLPTVASGKKVEGTFNILLLAAHKDMDAYSPQYDGSGEYAYYKVKTADGVQTWKINVSPSSVASQTDEQVTFTESSVYTGQASWLNNAPYIAAASPNSGMLAANIQTADGGLWIFTSGSQEAKKFSDYGGGSILLWSPDGSKLLFSDTKGILYVAYPAENIIMQVAEGQVKDVSWSQNSRGILFSWLRADSNNWAIYTAVLP